MNLKIQDQLTVEIYAELKTYRVARHKTDEAFGFAIQLVEVDGYTVAEAVAVAIEEIN